MSNTDDDAADPFWAQMPEWCTLDHGEGATVKLADALATLTSWRDIQGIVIDHPLRGRIRPWRFIGDGAEVRIGPDGRLYI